MSHIRSPIVIFFSHCS